MNEMGYGFNINSSAVLVRKCPGCRCYVPIGKECPSCSEEVDLLGPVIFNIAPDEEDEDSEEADTPIFVEQENTDK